MTPPDPESVKGASTAEQAGANLCGSGSTASSPLGGSATERQPRLLDRVRNAVRARHYSPRTEKVYVAWIKRFIFFHGVRHPDEMGEREVTQFLTSLATQGKVSASTHNQALAALLFLYRKVLGRDLEWLQDVVRAKRPVRMPVVLSRTEVSNVLCHLRGTTWLMASLMYGSGLRLLECARLRVKDVDLPPKAITVRDGKGRKDRVTVLPAKLVDPLAQHLIRTRRQFDDDVRRGAGYVELPDALVRKYPNAAREWGWQWVFPATRFYYHKETGQRRRHHLHESVLQRSVKDAVRAAGIPKSASSHTLRHYLASPTMSSDFGPVRRHRKIHITTPMA